MDREDPDTGCSAINGDDCAAFDVGAMRLQNLDDVVSDRGRQDVLGSYLDDTWTARSGRSKKSGEVQVACETTQSLFLAHSMIAASEARGSPTVLQ